MGRYFRHRITRLSSTAESIAMNLATGSAVSFTPFFGLHVLIALGVTWVLGFRMNIIASVVGTFIGNPWTFPFLMIASYSTGSFLLQLVGLGDGHMVTVGFHTDGQTMIDLIWENFADLYIPTALGGIGLMIISIPFYYVLYLYLVRAAQRARRLRLKMKQRRQFNKGSKP